MATAPVAPPAPAPRPAALAPGRAMLADDAVAVTTPDAGVAIDAAAMPAVLPAWRLDAHTDADALAPLRVGEVTRVKFNRGGSSLSLRLEFDNGARAAFKPEQVHPQSNPRREIAAFRVDRLLGLDRVPPAIGRTFAMATLRAAIASDERGRAFKLDDEAVPRKDGLRGELSWWIPIIKDAKVDGFRIDETDGIVTWKRMLRPGTAIPAEDYDVVHQISDMVTFDFLLDNTDRWSGNNAKVSEDGKVLYFMDNTMAFTSNPKGHRKSHIYLNRVQTFSRRLIDRIRALTEDELRAAVADDVEPFPMLLTDREIGALMARRDLLISYVDDLIAEHGEAAILAFP
ncbi:MAG: hypothetical protein H6709_11000 [Kofleriaceae bacterium]|nr:hypothetical protein [Kofleriaceae bacterium]